MPSSSTQSSASIEDFQSEAFAIERDGNVATLWLNRPESRNAIGSSFFDDLPIAMDLLNRDRNVWVVVIAAKGPAFSVGLDLKNDKSAAIFHPETLLGIESDKHAVKALGVWQLCLQHQESFNAVAECRKPTIAAIHGYCVGGGLDLAAACDIRVAAADARFSIIETKRAIVADMGSIQRLEGVLGRGHLRELAYTSRVISAERAAQIGLVNDVYPTPADVHEAAMALALEIAGNSPLAVQGTKVVLEASEGNPARVGLEFVALWQAAMLQSDDLGEAVSAFVEKRVPTYRGS